MPAKIGEAALLLKIDKAQVAAEAAAAVDPAIAASAQKASQTLTTATGNAVTPKIQAMLDDLNAASTRSAEAVAKSGQATQQALASLDQQSQSAGGGVLLVGNNAAGASTKLRAFATASNAASLGLGGAAGQAASFAQVLTTGGVVGGIALSALALAKFGESLNDTEKSLKDLQDLASVSSSQDLVASTVTSETFGNMNENLEKLGESGPKGLGTLLNLRDAYAEAGQDTTKFTDAIYGTLTALRNQDSATERGAAQLHEWGINADGSAESAKRLADAARQLEATTNNQATAQASLLTSQVSIAGAEERVRKARAALADEGTEQTGRSAREERNLAEAVENASQRIVDAQQKVIDARQKVADAQEELAHAGEHERLDVQDAQDAVDAALRKRNASTPEERGPAQHALEDAQQKLVDAKRALDSAKPDAERALNSAVRDLADAEQDEVDSHRKLADANADLAESHDKAKDSTKDHQAAVDDLNSALIAQAEAIAHQREIQAELATGIKVGPVEALGFLKQALADVAGQLDPNSDLARRITYLLASMTPEGAQRVLQSANSASGNIPRLAGGGFARGGSLFEMSEAGAEAVVMPHGIYRAPPGGVQVLNARDTAALGSTTHQTNYVTVVAQSEPAERAIRRELERLSWQAGG